MSITYGTIREARQGTGSPLRRSATGYGPKIATAYEVRLTSDSPTGRFRRVYAMSYGNAASFYVIVRGEDIFLNEIELEIALERTALAAHADLI